MFNIRLPLATPHISQINLPDGYPPLAPICSETLTLGTTTNREFSTNGTRVSLSCSPYFDVHGKILGLTMVATEFPGLAREMEMILNSSSVHVLNRTLDGRILRISESTARALGTTRTKAEGTNIFDLYSGERAEQSRAEASEIMRGVNEGVVKTIEVHPISQEKPTYLAMERHRFLEHGTEEPAIFMVASDVTTAVEASDLTNEILERFRNLQELSDAGYWELDPVKGEIYWSAKVAKLHGLKEGEPTPKLDEAMNYYHPDDVDIVAQKVADASEAGGNFEFTARLIRKDGKEIRVRCNGIAILDGGGNLAKLVGTFGKAQTA